MKIAIIGFGQIGKTLAGKLSAAGHQVRVAASRDPETIAAEAAELGAQAFTAAQAVDGVDVVILSTPLTAVPSLAATVASLPASTVVIVSGTGRAGSATNSRPAERRGSLGAARRPRRATPRAGRSIIRLTEGRAGAMI